MESRKFAGTFLSVTVKTCLFILIVVALYFVGRLAYGFGHDVFDEQPMAADGSGVEIIVDIPVGSSVGDIADILAQKGLVSSAVLFKTQARLSDYYKKFIPGTYTLSTEMTPTEIMVVLCTKPEEETTEAK